MANAGSASRTAHSLCAMRGWLVRFVLLLSVMLPVMLYAYAERACPPPTWAFWMDDKPQVNFAFLESCD